MGLSKFRKTPGAVPPRSACVKERYAYQVRVVFVYNPSWKRNPELGNCRRT